ncbi:MAG TPA: hypothetical protein VF178_13680 [Gemmatimonadaceae bacterium]
MYQGSYCWGNLCVDTVGPRELVSDAVPVVVAPGATVTLELEVAPDDLTLVRWDDDDTTPVALDGGRRFPAPSEPGTYLYSAFARWDGQGDASYAFVFKVE